eukprot:8173369-Pyramimonas_sp.AAC.1
MGPRRPPEALRRHRRRPRLPNKAPIGPEDAPIFPLIKSPTVERAPQCPRAWVEYHPLPLPSDVLFGL